MSWAGEYPQAPLPQDEARAMPFRAAFVDAVLALRTALGVRDIGAVRLRACP
jgi:hypothetical protein